MPYHFPICLNHSGYMFLCRLARCTSIITGEEGALPRCKPFKYTYEKEIVIYPLQVLILLLISESLFCAFHSLL